MKLKLIAAICLIVAIPVCAPAQGQAPKVTKADAQKVVKMISADKTKTQMYCDMTKLGDQIGEADQNKDSKKIDELSKKMDDISQKMGPDYIALMDGLQDMDPNSKEGQDISAVLDGLDRLCAK